jgi:hypothetical protein
MCKVPEVNGKSHKAPDAAASYSNKYGSIMVKPLSFGWHEKKVTTVLNSKMGLSQSLV